MMKTSTVWGTMRFHHLRRGACAATFLFPCEGRGPVARKRLITVIFAGALKFSQPPYAGRSHSPAPRAANRAATGRR
jgi:hypothetical protein